MERAESANANHTFDRAPDRWMQKMISKIFAESAHYPPPPDLRPPQFPRGVYSELVVPSAPRAADFGHPFAVQPAAAGPPGSGIAPAPGMCTNTREWVAHPPYGLVGSVNGVRSVKREVSSVNRGQRGWMNGWIGGSPGAFKGVGPWVRRAIAGSQPTASGSFCGERLENRQWHHVD
eukprot:gene7826-biopygen9108